MQPLQCDSRLSDAKRNSTASAKKKKVTWNHQTITSTARAKRTGIETKVTTPATVAHASQLVSATEAPFTRKKHCFAQILTFKSHPTDSCKRSFRARLPSNSKISRTASEAFVRGFLHVLNSNPLYSTQLNSALLCLRIS